MNRTFTAYIEFDTEAQLYVANISGLRGGHSQGATLDELEANLKEVVQLILEEGASQEGQIEIQPLFSPSITSRKAHREE
jgi:predicted RNase H-like HicB family nuclease